jgi:hypothetical protein
MVRTRWFPVVCGGVVAVAGLLSLAGCSDDRPSKEELVEALTEDGLDEAAATCSVNGFYDDVSAAGLERIVAGSESLPDADDQAAFTASFRSCTGVGFTDDAEGG